MGEYMDIKHKKKLFGFWGLFCFLILFVPCFIGSYYLLAAIYGLTGMPSPIIAQLLTVVVAFFLMVFLFRIVLLITHRCGRRRKVYDRHRKNMGRSIYHQTIDAMEKISEGDFDVFVDTEDMGAGPHSELADSINKMARELSSMEHMRQDFVSNVSHEIQSPLTSIQGFADLLKEEDLDVERRCHYVGIIEAESARLSKLSENLLKLSALDANCAPVTPSPYRLDKQIEEVILLLEPQWLHKEIELDIALDEYTFNGDKELLHQVWTNLINNAIKFTPNRGRIAISLQGDGDKVVVAIADNGIGIEENSIPRIFERFYKADQSRDRSRGGNGLGLALVKKIVDLHQGEVAVDSAVAEGTTITVSLPLRE